MIGPSVEFVVLLDGLMHVPRAAHALGERAQVALPHLHFVWCVRSRLCVCLSTKGGGSGKNKARTVTGFPLLGVTVTLPWRMYAVSLSPYVQGNLEASPVGFWLGGWGEGCIVFGW